MLRVTPLFVVLCEECIAGNRQPREQEESTIENRCAYIFQI